MWWLLTSFILITFGGVNLCISIIALCNGGNVWIGIVTIILTTLAILLSLVNIINLIDSGV